MFVNIEIAKADLRVVIAAREYVARRDHITQTVGHIQSVLGSLRWYTDETLEHRGGCDLVRVPSPSHPFSLRAHCCSACHIAELSGVNSSDVRRAACVMKKQANNKADALLSQLTGGAK